MHDNKNNLILSSNSNSDNNNYSNNNNYNNNNKIKLPFYLQEIILNNFSIFINSQISIKIDKESIDKKKKIFKSLLSVSLVSWGWFNKVGSNINTFINFDWSLSKYSLIKPEYIHYLKITQDKPLYDMEYINFINKKIKELINLNKILFSNYNNNFKIDFIEFNNIKIKVIDTIILNRQYNSNNNDNDNNNNNNNLLPNNIKQLGGINISSQYKSHQIINLFKNIEIKSIDIEYYDGDEVFPFKQLEENNSLKSIIDISFTDQLNIEQLYHILKGCPNLRGLVFGICYDNLFYHLSNYETLPCKCFLKQLKRLNNNNDNDDNDDNDDNRNNNSDDQQKEDNFQILWDSISEIIVSNKTISTFSIENQCKITNCSKFNQLSDYPMVFVHRLGSMISNNNSIRKIMLFDFHTPQLFKYILKAGNKTILEYYSSIVKNKQSLYYDSSTSSDISNLSIVDSYENSSSISNGSTGNGNGFDSNNSFQDNFNNCNNNNIYNNNNTPNNNDNDNDNNDNNNNNNNLENGNKKKHKNNDNICYGDMGPYTDEMDEYQDFFNSPVFEKSNNFNENTYIEKVTKFLEKYNNNSSNHIINFYVDYYDGVEKKILFDYKKNNK